MVYDTRLYDILTVSTTATIEEITKSYKKLALKYHPDKTNHDPVLTEKFKDATHAYEILKDPRQRSVYDAYGESGLDGSIATQEPPSAPVPNVNVAAHGPFPFPSGNTLFSQIFNDVSSVFGASLPFGDDMANPFDFATYNTEGMSKSVQPAPPDPAANRVHRGEDIHHTFDVSLADMYYGKVAKFLLPKITKCSTCKGVGCLQPRTCRVCKGSGRVVVTMVNQFSKFQEVGSCSPCNGTGVYCDRNSKCRRCDNGFLMEKKLLLVNIFPGSKDGDKIILKGQADEGRNIIPGDVVIHIHETPHPFLVRKFNDLYMEHDIDLRTALLGGSILVHDFLRLGNDLRIYVNSHGDSTLNDMEDPSIKQGQIVGSINSGSPKIVKGLGMPINNKIRNGVIYQNGTAAKFDLPRYKRGDLFIKFNVQIPLVGQFSTSDLEMLGRILPAPEKINQPAQQHHLANLPYDDGNVPMADVDLDASDGKRKSDGSSDEFDYDQLEIDSDGANEEHEDDQFYAQKWSEPEQKKKRRKNNNSRNSTNIGKNTNDNSENNNNSNNNKNNNNNTTTNNSTAFYMGPSLVGVSG